jgi:predicted ATPase/DNA-binding SARP family transcriptional activator
MPADIRLLGAFEVVIDGHRVPGDRWRRRHASAVVKLLALQPGRRLLREQLIELLWPGLTVAEAAPRLHKAAHFARTAIGINDGVVLAGDTVALLPTAEVSVDVERFERAADAAARAVAEGSDPLRPALEAVDRYRGDLLPEDLYEPWTEEHRERLRLRYLELLRLTERWEELVTADPTNEEAHLRLVHRLATQGDRRGALRHYEHMERVLREELGIAPGETALALREAVLALPEEHVDAAITSSGTVTPLPVPTSRIIGREQDVADALRTLHQARVVTLLGPGGVGKTTLAVEVARRWCETTATEACFVDLTQVGDAALVPGLVARELGIHRPAGPDAEDMLREAVRGRSLLLLLDNFEHVLGAAELVTLLASCSAQLRVLVTSRALLRVSGEHVVEVGPLLVQGADPEAAELTDDATELFAEVARSLDPSFEIGRHRHDVAAICRTLDGLPLAIKLAAGHVRTLSPPLLRARLGARLASPEAADRDSPARQQTIPATIGWSLQFLGDEERRLFVRLGVFAGPVAIEVVEAVCAAPGGDVVDGLFRLVDHSLVRRLTGPGGEPRFGMLELVREHARLLLAESDEASLRRRHAEHVAELLESLEERRWTVLADRWIDLMNDVLPEVRSAHAWAQANADWCLAARITGALGTYWHREGHHVEGRTWVEQALEHEDEYDESLVGRLLLAAGFMAWPLNDPVRTRDLWAGAVRSFRAVGDKRYLAFVLGLLPGTYVGDADNYEVGMRLCEESLALARDVGDLPLIAQTLNVQGELARVHGDDALALSAYTEGLALAQQCHDEGHASVLLANLAYLADHRGDYEEARRLGCEALRLCWSLGRRMMAAWTVSELAGPELGLGRPRRGARLVGAANRALETLGVGIHPGDLPERERVLAGLKAALGEDELTQLAAEGARLSLREAVALALSEKEMTDEPEVAASVLL